MKMTALNKNTRYTPWGWCSFLFILIAIVLSNAQKGTYLSDMKAVRAILDANNLLDIMEEEVAMTDDNERVVDISLSKLNIEVLPPQIGRLRALQSLDLSRNKLSTLPGSIGDLKQLVSLNLSYNDLKELPPEIGKLKSLKTLILNFNKLTVLPGEMSGLHKLEQLYISMNQLKTLPSSIVEISPSLFVNNNRLCALPALVEGWIMDYSRSNSWKRSQECREDDIADLANGETVSSSPDESAKAPAPVLQKEPEEVAFNTSESDVLSSPPPPAEEEVEQLPEGKDTALLFKEAPPLELATVTDEMTAPPAESLETAAVEETISDTAEAEPVVPEEAPVEEAETVVPEEAPVENVVAEETPTENTTEESWEETQAVPATPIPAEPEKIVQAEEIPTPVVEELQETVQAEEIQAPAVTAEPEKQIEAEPSPPEQGNLTPDVNEESWEEVVNNKVSEPEPPEQIETAEADSLSDTLIQAEEKTVEPVSAPAEKSLAQAEEQTAPISDTLPKTEAPSVAVITPEESDTAISDEEMFSEEGKTMPVQIKKPHVAVALPSDEPDSEIKDQSEQAPSTEESAILASAMPASECVYFGKNGFFNKDACEELEAAKRAKALEEKTLDAKDRWGKSLYYNFSDLKNGDNLFRNAVTMEMKIDASGKSLRIYKYGKLAKKFEGFDVIDLSWRVSQEKKGVYFLKANIDGMTVVNRLDL
ncbi:MAG: hypothetical protein HQK83_02470 [Fibrobacteria bacterium]|nr:hypothetical protein [Fibrobacteria bacterium]